jgi:hypothetical protein
LKSLRERKENDMTSIRRFGFALAFLGVFLMAACDWSPAGTDTKAPTSIAGARAPGQATMQMKGSLAIKKIPAGKKTSDLSPIAPNLPQPSFYAQGLPDDAPTSAWLRTTWEESKLHARVALLGLWRGLAHGQGVVAIGRLYATVVHPDGHIAHHGLISTALVTTAGVNYLRDDFAAGAGSADISTFKYHEAGTGTNAEAVGDTALQTPCTTVLNPDSTRAVGTQDNGTSKHYKSVGTLTFDGSAAVTEHGLFQAASTGTLWDRSVFSAINVASGDSIQFTYDLTLSDGG